MRRTLQEPVHGGVGRFAREPCGLVTMFSQGVELGLVPRRARSRPTLRHETRGERLGAIAKSESKEAHYLASPRAPNFHSARTSSSVSEARQPARKAEASSGASR